MFWFLPFLCCLCSVNGHGRLRIPPQRSSLWREGLSTMINTDDNQLNCGGYAAQHNIINGGKCGVCGDKHDGVQDHQPPGKYAQGIISRCYKPGTRWIDVNIEITANHLGYIQFKLCPNNNVKRAVTQQCLDNYNLKIKDVGGADHGYIYRIKWFMKNLSLKIELPDELECSQCVLQWTYTTGNNWGCSNQNCGLGYGSQETFVNCADIAVTDDCPNQDIPRKTNSDYFGILPTANENLNKNCVAVGIWAREKNEVISKWCQVNCHFICPPDYCYCS